MSNNFEKNFLGVQTLINKVYEIYNKTLKINTENKKWLIYTYENDEWKWNESEIKAIGNTLELNSINLNFDEVDEYTVPEDLQMTVELNNKNLSVIYPLINLKKFSNTGDGYILEVQEEEIDQPETEEKIKKKYYGWKKFAVSDTVAISMEDIDYIIQED